MIKLTIFTQTKQLYIHGRNSQPFTQAKQLYIHGRNSQPFTKQLNRIKLNEVN